MFVLEKQEKIKKGYLALVFFSDSGIPLAQSSFYNMLKAKVLSFDKTM